VIRYALRCGCGHGFDAWFANGAAYDALAAQGLVTCPACGTNAVEKAPMAPAIARRRSETAPAERASPDAPTAAASPVMNHEAAVRAALRSMVRHVKAVAEDVGTRFPEEARRIHHGEAATRAIWGRATREEAQALREDGIEARPLPDLSDHDA
jgi:hypothetical protein